MSRWVGFKDVRSFWFYHTS